MEYKYGLKRNQSDFSTIFLSFIKNGFSIQYIPIIVPLPQALQDPMQLLSYPNLHRFCLLLGNKQTSKK